jgi:triacylglycerol esterase/lipase EstA (alpha/beta hydrolase family)
MGDEHEQSTEISPMPQEEDAPQGSAFWSTTGRFFGTVGTAIGQAAVKTGQSAAAAYQAVDPDARKHLAQLPVMGLSMLGPRSTTVEPLPDDGHNPIVLVHGLAGHPGNFMALRQYLALKGRKRVYAIDFGSAESIDLMAAMLRDFITAVVERNELPDDAQVDLVAHSMGGVVTRMAVEDPATARRIACVITMASPHSGTYTARLGATTPTTELRPGSAVVERMARQLPWDVRAGRPRLVALWSAADLIVLPGEGGQVPGAENIELPGYTHYSYFLNPEAWRLIHRLMLGLEG